MVRYVPAYTKGTLKKQKKKTVKDLSNDAYAMFFFMPPTAKKLEGHVASGAFVHPSVRSSRFLMHSITLEPCMLLF